MFPFIIHILRVLRYIEEVRSKYTCFPITKLGKASNTVVSTRGATESSEGRSNHEQYYDNNARSLESLF
jgi:hypothetical protein